MGLWLIDVAFKESEDSSSFIIHRDDVFNSMDSWGKGEPRNPL
jgi:hypothetical protein